MRPKKLVGVYAIVCTVNGMQYVGSAQDVRNRWGSHRWRLRKGRHHNEPLQADWDQYGEGAFEFKMLAEVPDEGIRRAIEQSYIDCVLGDARAYNRSPSSLSNAGIRYTEAQRESVSQALKGKPKSEAHRAALSEAATRRWATVSPEERQQRMAAMGRGNLGKAKSAEHRRNIGLGHARLTEDQVREIKRRLRVGETNRAIAQEFGVQACTIYSIKRGRTWSHVE
jgi:group I intron endonuclease